MFNLTSQIAITRYQLVIERMFDRFETVFDHRWFRLLSKTYTDIAKRLTHGDRDFSNIIEEQRQDIVKLESTMLRQITAFFGNFTFDRFRDSLKKDVQIKSMEDVFWQDVSAWAQTHTMKRATDISKSTWSMIDRDIQRGLQEGLSNNDIAKTIREKDEAINKMRSLRIVKTETHTAANKAIDVSVKSTGYSFDRKWASAKDNRVRGVNPKDKFDHIKANGQIRDMDTPFDVSNEKLMYPGDSNGSAGNIVNCRCVLTYNIKRLAA